MRWLHVLFGFSGRSTRQQFWLHQLLVYGLLFGVPILIAVIGLATGLISQTELSALKREGSASPQSPTDPINAAIGFAVIIGFLAFIISSFAIAVRRLHDRGKSGWWLLLMLALSVVVVGSIWYVIELGFLEGQPAANKYGEDPLAEWRRGMVPQAF